VRKLPTYEAGKELIGFSRYGGEETTGKVFSKELIDCE